MADTITPKEMDRKYHEAMAERERQKDVFVPQRQIEVLQIKTNLKRVSSFDPKNKQSGDEFA